MSGVLSTVDQRTRLVGENRLEMLTFSLDSKQLFGINVFKVKEVVRLPELTLIPHSHPVVCGVTHLRGQTIPVMDLSLAIGRKPIQRTEKCNIIVCEYNNSVQAFLIGNVDRIVNLNWDALFPPPNGIGTNHYLTATTQLDGKIVGILDVEKILSEVSPYDTTVSEDVLDPDACNRAKGMKLLLADDSAVARYQASQSLEQVGLEIVMASNGEQALEQLQQWAQQGMDFRKELLMLITDAEMPQMDGYRLTTEIRKDPRLKEIYIVLHTSLSGSFNQAMVKKVGCDNFVSKYDPDDLAVCAQDRVRQLMEEDANRA